MTGIDPSWKLDAAGSGRPLVHAEAGTTPPDRVTQYHYDFARIELARPLDYYASRIRAIGFNRGERVLDAACGVGQWSVALARVNPEVHGVDQAVERLAIAERLASVQAATGLHFTHGDVLRLPFPDGYFDAVLCYGVLMFLPLDTALAELSRVLRPGGRLYVCANGPGWPLLLILRRHLIRSGLRTLGNGVARRPGGFLTRRRLRAAADRRDLRLQTFAQEARISVRRDAPTDEPAYLGRYAGLTCVFEAILEKPAGDAPASPPIDRQSLGDSLIDGMRNRGQQFDRPDRLVPADVVEIDAHYALPRAHAVQGELPIAEQQHRLDAIASALVEGARDNDDRVVRILRFVQDTLYHHPLAQPPPELSPYEVLELGDARCGDVARVAVELLRRAGIPARRRQFVRHVVAEAFVDGEWRIVDGDAFKNGIVLRSDDGGLLTMQEVALNPAVIDRFPPTGWWARADSRYARNAGGELVRGYVDALNPEQRGFVSSYYAPWSEHRHPPSVPELHPAPDARAPALLRLSWQPSVDPDGDLRGYRVRIGTASRGWSYERMQYDRLPTETGTEVGEFEVTEPWLELEIDDPGTYFWSVKAIDDRTIEEPRTFYWSSEEGSFTLT